MFTCEIEKFLNMMMMDVMSCHVGELKIFENMMMHDDDDA